MFKYFKELKETRELKKLSLQYQVLLLGKLYEFSSILDEGHELVELANKLKDVSQEDLIKEVAKIAKESKEAE